MKLSKTIVTIGIILSGTILTITPLFALDEIRGNSDMMTESVSEMHEIVLFLSNLEKSGEDMERIMPVVIEELTILTAVEAESRFGNRGSEGAIVIRTRADISSLGLSDEALVELLPPDNRGPFYTDPDDVYAVVEEMPQMEGGMSALYQKLRYPEEALNEGIEGTVLLSFIVDESGRPGDITVLQRVGGGLDREAALAIQGMSFTPGTHRGEAVKVRMTLPVTFRLN
ncbi:MAG: TonB family protein [Balneolales bacterium]|nr:TonB family protein [Balneolales bacterium]